ncbi:MAG: aminotransferase class V-fold PLP-dependent enzyme [Terriglobales bacterium]
MASMGANDLFAEDFGPFDGRVWLNTAHQGPLPRVAVEAARAAVEQKARPYLLRDGDFLEVPGRLRAALGKLIGAAPEDIILGNSTSYGLDLLANGMQWQRGDEVLVVDGDFPADIFPWLILRSQGVTVRFLQARAGQVDPQQLALEISPQTRLFCTSWVNSFSGYAIDVDGLGQVCRKNHVIFVLNAAQGLGARVLDVQNSPVDAMTCCGFKWLCGPYATGFCWLAPALRESLTIRHAYWLTMQAGKPLDKMCDYSLRNDLGARAWDVFCTANFLNFIPWTAAIEYLLQAGPANVADYDQRLITQLVQTLDEDRFELISPRTGPQRSTLVVIRPQKAEEVGAWQERLSGARFDIALREGNLRISPHLHNSQEDIANLVGALST